MKKITTLLFLITIAGKLILSQQIYFQEGFETEHNRLLWEQESDDSNPAPWEFRDGGAEPPGNITTRLPANAINGVYNAMFFKQSPNTYETYLVSPPFSLELAEKPQLRFYYAQYPNEIPGGDKDNSRFTICYRTPEHNNEWVPIKEYTLATSGWVFDSLPLNDSIKYADIQLGFLGISSTVSFGSCIDSIMIIETDTVNKYVDQVLASHPNQDILPTGSYDNPILKIEVPVKGNHSELILKQIKIDALLETEQVVPVNGVRIYITQTEHFTRTNPIGDTISFIGGQAFFSNLNYSLPFGTNYLWVTVDIAEDTEHKFKDLRVDVKVPKNGILLNDKYFSSEYDLDPNGYRIVNESIFYDDFEGAINWDLVTEFEIDSAYGKGGYLQNPDPTYATSGFKVLGTDLSGLGFAPGDYEPFVPEDGYTATSPTFDCSYFKDLNLQFYRWLNVSADDYVKIEYSTDDKTSWDVLWDNTLGGDINKKVPFAESQWHFIEHGLSSSLDRAPSVTFRFTTGPTGQVTMHSGWNIDNFALTGNYVNHDVGVSAFLTPNDGSGLSNNETVTVKIKNFGFDPSSDKIPVGYSIDNGYTWVTDTLEQVLAQEEETTFIFGPKLDLSTPGVYRLLVSTLLDIDEDSRNDLIDTTLYSFPYAELPYFEDFENSDGVWRAGGSTMEWEHGVPTGAIIDTAYSGNNAWVTNLNGDYENDSYSYLEGPSFNFTNIDKPIFECMLYTAGETGNDGLALEYSLDEGSNWVLVPKTGLYSWNWHNSTNISALGHEGWDIADNKWFKAREILPAAVANQPKVKFRFVFASNSSNTSEGFAIDDIRVYDAPTDAGITAIVDPISDCSLDKNQQVSITIHNYGIRNIKASDSLFASVQLNNDSIITDTFIVSSPIAIGGNKNFTFSGTFDMYDKNTYILDATVYAEGDTSYYGTDNNDFQSSVSILGNPHYTLGPDIGTLTPENESLDAGAGYTSYTWTNHHDMSTSSGRIYNVNIFPVGVYAIDYSIFAQNASGCISKDTIRVMKSISDLSVTNVTGLSNTCFNGQIGQNIVVTLENASLDTTYQIGNKLVVGCEIDENNILYDTITLASTLGQNQSVTHNFSQSIIYPEYGNFEVKVYPQLNGDLDFSNDTTYNNIEVYKPADVDFSADTILSLLADTIVLDAGENMKDIYWLGSTTPGARTYNISSKMSDKYYVQATDINNCNTDSDTVFIVGDSWTLTEVKPDDMCEPSSSEQVTLSIKNTSNNSYSAGVNTIKATVNFDGTNLEADISMPAMNPGDTYDYTFSQVFDMSNAKDYPIVANILPETDINRLDNTINEDITVWGIREINLGDDVATKRADTIILNPGTFFSSYTWQDGSTTPTYQINDRRSSKYWVSAEDENNCASSSDTIEIFATDISMVNIVSPSKSCNVGSLKTLKFTIENTGNDTIFAGDSITIAYQIDSRPTEELFYKFSYDFNPGNKRTITLYDEFNFDANSTHSFVLNAIYRNDFFSDNNSANSTVFQLDVPSVDLGPDIYTSRGDSITLNAPSGYSSYRWQNGSREEYFNITYNGSYAYWVKVTNSDNCSTTDSVKIIAGDIVLANVTGIQDENCTGTIYSDTISVGYNLTYDIAVTGTDTLRSGQAIRLLYSTNNGYTEYKNIILSEDYYAGKNYQYSFQDKMVKNIGEYEFYAKVEVANDFNPDNNIYESTFKIGPYNIGLPDSVNTINEYAELTANSGFSSYSWSTGETTQSINVYNNGTYYVEASPGFNCPSKDTTHVKFDGNRAISTISNINDSVCIKSESIFPEIIIQNIGDSIWQAGQTVQFIHKFNNGSQYLDTKTILNNKGINDTIMHTLSQSILLENIGANALILRTDVNGQTVSEKTFNIEVLDLPVFSFSTDTVYVSSYPTTIDPEIDNVSYLWSTGETTKTISVNKDDTYTLTVTNAGGCSHTESVTTRLGTKIIETFDHSVKVYPNPTNNKLYISIPNEFNDVNILVSDVSGRVVLLDRIPSNGSKIIEVGNWVPGVYVVRLYNSTNQSVHRIIVTD